MKLRFKLSTKENEGVQSGDDLAMRVAKALRTHLRVESKGMQQVFALVWEQVASNPAKVAEACPVSGLQPGALFRMAKQSPETAKEIWNSLVMVADRDTQTAAERQYHQLLIRGFEIAEGLPLKSGPLSNVEICLHLGWLAQALLAPRSHSDFGRENLTIAEELQKSAHGLLAPLGIRAAKKPSNRDPGRDGAEPPRRPFVPPVPRVDETVGILQEAGDISVWCASHIGPAYANKAENQDATYALARGGRIVFAVADGVGTSLGSRYAAQQSAQMFCEFVAESMPSYPLSAVDADALLKEAAASVQRNLRNNLEAIMADRSPAKWDAIRGVETSTDRTIELLAENTFTRRMPQIPALMETTLVAGVIEPAPKGACVWMMRIGDGIAEVLDETTGEVLPLYEMDSEQTKIATRMGPATACADLIPNEVIQSQTLAPNSLLFLSSDGLTRGHRLGLVDVLRENCAAELSELKKKMPAAGRNILLASVKAAEKADNPKMFADNLSLIVIRVAGRS